MFWVNARIVVPKNNSYNDNNNSKTGIERKEYLRHDKCWLSWGVRSIGKQIYFNGIVHKTCDLCAHLWEVLRTHAAPRRPHSSVYLYNTLVYGPRKMVASKITPSRRCIFLGSRSKRPRVPSHFDWYSLCEQTSFFHLNF